MIHLDDILILNQSSDRILEDMKTVVFVLENFGFMVNWKKMLQQPRKVMQYLGLLINSTEMTLSLPRVKLTEIVAECSCMIRLPRISVRKLARLIGKLAASIHAVFTEQTSSTHQLKEACRNPEIRCIRSENKECKQDLLWWIKNLEACNGRSLLLPPKEFHINTDTSNTEWDVVR